MPFAIYDTNTGKIRCIGSHNIGDCSASEAEIEIDGYTYTHIINSMPVFVVEQPTADQIMYDVRRQRNQLLNAADVEYCNAEKWANMSAELQLSWRNYKQALRDFPETCNLEKLEWPLLPSG